MYAKNRLWNCFKIRAMYYNLMYTINYYYRKSSHRTHDVHYKLLLSSSHRTHDVHYKLLLS